MVKQMTHEEIQDEMMKVGGLGEQSPSNPAFRGVLAGSYRETLLRQDADDQVRSVMLATATGTDLDHIGITYYRGVDGLPVLRLDGESNDEYRQRLHESPAGLSTAGPVSAYEFHSKSAHPNIKQALCTSPEPVVIEMVLLGKSGKGEVSETQCELVEAYLWDRRPMTDKVTAVSAEIIEYEVEATIYQAKNSDPDAVTAKAIEQARAYVNLQHRLKGRVSTSALHAVMTAPGVEEVELHGWTDILCTQKQAPYCIKLTVTNGGWIDDRAA
ncbi:MAG: baseplate assembly protein [Aeromonadaceae bacterium]